MNSFSITYSLCLSFFAKGKLAKAAYKMLMKLSG